MVPRSLSLVSFLFLALVLAACKSPTEPAHGMASVSMGCGPSGSNVQCSLTAYNIGGDPSRDATSDAEWLSTGASGSFVQPGLFVPSSSGEVTIWARYKTFEPPVRSIFLVSPGQPARRITFVGGNVKSAANGQLLTGVTVRVLDGYGAGHSSVTNSLGYYSISPILTGETFTLEASKEGYATLRTTYRVDTQPFFDLSLQPLAL